MRIVITGHPHTGKTTLARLLSIVLETEYRSTDMLIGIGWSTLSDVVSTWFDEGINIIEGVAVPRALRKWHSRNPDANPPFDIFIYMRAHFATMKPEHRNMAKGLDTVMLELWGWLSTITVIRFGPA
jgi:energy-coupling factor transporter ATP-binding protein EcfA2